MKTLLYLIAAVGVLGIATPSNAAPPFFNQRRIVSYLGNGVPVYAVYQIVGYNAMGFPIYQWVTQPVGPVYGRSYNYGYRHYNYRPSYVHPHYGGHVGHFSHGGGHVSHGGHSSHGGGHGHH